jgi:hypothetical protein
MTLHSPIRSNYPQWHGNQVRSVNQLKVGYLGDEGLADMNHVAIAT